MLKAMVFPRLTWVWREPNLFHLGIELTLVEVYEQVAPAQLKWAAHCVATNLTRAACPTKGEFPDERQYASFVSLHVRQYIKEGNRQYFDKR